MLRPQSQAQAIEYAEMLLSVVEVLIGGREELHDVSGCELALLLSVIRDTLASAPRV